jgi:hypothetical protein
MLGADMIAEIFRWLPPIDVCRYESVCRLWRDVGRKILPPEPFPAVYEKAIGDQPLDTNYIQRSYWVVESGEMDIYMPRLILTREDLASALFERMLNGESHTIMFGVGMWPSVSMSVNMMYIGGILKFELMLFQAKSTKVLTFVSKRTISYILNRLRRFALNNEQATTRCSEGNFLYASDNRYL